MSRRTWPRALRRKRCATRLFRVVLIALVPLIIWIGWDGHHPWVFHTLFMAGSGGGVTLWFAGVFPSVYTRHARYKHWLQFHLVVWVFATIYAWEYWFLCSIVAGGFSVPWAAPILFFSGILVLMFRTEVIRAEMLVGCKMYRRPRHMKSR